MELPSVGDHNRSLISPSPSVLAGGSLASKPTANVVASSSRATNTTTATEHEVANSQSLGTDIRMTSSIQLRRRIDSKNEEQAMHQQLQQAEDLQQQAEKLQQQAAAMQQQAAEIHKQMQKNRAANANGQSVPAAASQQTSSSAKPVPAAADPQMPQRDIVMKPLTQQVVQGSLQVGQSVSSVSSDRRPSEAMPGVGNGGGPPILSGSGSGNAAAVAPPILPSSSAAGSTTNEAVQRSQAPTTSLVVEPVGSAAAAGGGDGLVDKHIQGSPIELKAERRRRRSESSSSSQPKDKAAISVSDEKIISELKQGLPGGAVSTSLKDFRQMALLGEGAYSAVYKILRLSDNKIYALKKVKLPNLSEKEKQNSLNEVRLLASIQHENVIGYKESFYDDASRCLCIITEYADGGDLFQKISHHQKMRTFFREADVWHCTFGMCHGLKALHELKILHRDLKCANVFLGSKGEVKLGDLNVSKVAKRGLCMTQTGTPYYASPEVWRDMPYDAKSDMWSLGCVIYEMVALRPPFRADDMESLYRKILRGQYPRVPSVYSRDVNEVIALLLQVNPRQRPAVDVLLQLPVMQRHIHYDSASRKGGPRNVPTDLLNTIKMPKDANMSEVAGQMPRARYEDAIPEEPALEKDGYHSGRNRSSRRAKDALDQLRYNLDNNNQDADKRTNRLDSQSENHNQRGGHIDNQQHGVYPGPYRHTPQPHNPRREHSGSAESGRRSESRERELLQPAPQTINNRNVLLDPLQHRDRPQSSLDQRSGQVQAPAQQQIVRQASGEYRPPSSGTRQLQHPGAGREYPPQQQQNLRTQLPVYVQEFAEGVRDRNRGLAAGVSDRSGSIREDEEDRLRRQLASRERMGENNPRTSSRGAGAPGGTTGQYRPPQTPGYDRAAPGAKAGAMVYDESRQMFVAAENYYSGRTESRDRRILREDGAAVDGRRQQQQQRPPQGAAAGGPQGIGGRLQVPRRPQGPAYPMTPPNYQAVAKRAGTERQQQAIRGSSRGESRERYVYDRSRQVGEPEVREVPAVPLPRSTNFSPYSYNLGTPDNPVPGPRGSERNHPTTSEVDVTRKNYLRNPTPNAAPESEYENEIHNRNAEKYYLQYESQSSEQSGARGGVPGSLLVPGGGDRDRAQRYDALKARPDAASRNYSYEARVGGGGIGVNAGPGGHYSASSHHQVGVVGEVGGGRSGSGAQQQYGGVSGGAQIGGQQYSVNGHPGHHSSSASNSQSHHSHHHHRHGSGSGVKVPSGYNHHVVVDHRAAKPNNGRYGGNRVGRHASGGSKLVHIGRNEGYRPGQLAPMRVF